MFGGGQRKEEVKRPVVAICQKRRVMRHLLFGPSPPFPFWSGKRRFFILDDSRRRKTRGRIFLKLGFAHTVSHISKSPSIYYSLWCTTLTNGFSVRVHLSNVVQSGKQASKDSHRLFSSSPPLLPRTWMTNTQLHDWQIGPRQDRHSPSLCDTTDTGPQKKEHEIGCWIPY